VSPILVALSLFAALTGAAPPARRECPYAPGPRSKRWGYSHTIDNSVLGKTVIPSPQPRPL